MTASILKRDPNTQNVCFVLMNSDILNILCVWPELQLRKFPTRTCSHIVAYTSQYTHKHKKDHTYKHIHVHTNDHAHVCMGIHTHTHTKTHIHAHPIEGINKISVNKKYPKVTEHGITTSLAERPRLGTSNIQHSWQLFALKWLLVNRLCSSLTAEY